MNPGEFWAIVLVHGIIFGIASSYVASSKNRRGLSFFFVGFFLGIIGLLIAIGVTKLEPPPSKEPIGMDSIHCFYLYSNERIDRGILQMTGDSIVFIEEDDGYNFKIPYKIIDSVRLIESKELPKDSRLAAMAKGGPRIILEVRSKTSEGERSVDFFGQISQINLLSDMVINRFKPMRVETSEERKCPYCAETVKAAAVRCKHCGSDLQDLKATQAGTEFATIDHDVMIGDQQAFAKGEQVQIEQVNPDPNRPDHKYVVLSKSLNKHFRLSDKDLTQPPPPANS